MSFPAVESITLTGATDFLDFSNGGGALVRSSGRNIHVDVMPLLVCWKVEILCRLHNFNKAQQ
jgi:hypothetical protein